MSKLTEFLEQYGMNYSVLKTPALAYDLAGTPVEVPNQFHLTRHDTGAVISPKTVSKEYRQVSPGEVASRVDQFIHEGWITPDRGFLFGKGSHEVLAFRIDGGSLADQGRVAGEDWTHYLSLHNWQGGGGKIKGSIHSHRIVCLNTAMAAARMASFAIPHSGNVSENLDLAVSTWNSLREQIRLISDRVQVWSEVSTTQAEAEKIISKLYGIDGKEADDISTRTQNEYDFALSEFHNLNRGTFGKSLADVYNAITATNSHYAPAKSKESADSRMASLLDPAGSRHAFERETVAFLDTLAGVAF